MKEQRCMRDSAIFLISPFHAHCSIGCTQFSLRETHATGAVMWPTASSLCSRDADIPTANWGKARFHS